MLRRLGQSTADSPASESDEAAFPSLDEAFGLGEHPIGVRLYQGRASFFHPYALLQGMTFKADVLTLVFADAEVIVRGRGLHGLYVHLAGQRVAWVVEQGERYAAVGDTPAHVAKIERTPR